MTFKTTLSAALCVDASTLIVDGYAVDDDMVQFTFPSYLDPKGPRNVTIVEIDLSSYDHGEYTFLDQEVEVDDEGRFDVVDDECEIFSFEVRVSRPLKETDL